MCGIIGAINIKEGYIKYAFDKLLIRGRDGLGYMIPGRISPQKTIKQHMKIIMPLQDEFFIGNSRAIPTTEFQQGAAKNIENQQPFNNGNYSLVFNGLIANDNELKDKYNIVTHQPVDTAILSPLFSKLGVIEGMKKLQGGFSIISVKNNTIWFGKNFMPMYYYQDNKGILICSIPEMFHPDIRNKIQTVEPYHCYVYDNNKKKIQKISLLEKVKEKKVMVIASSGIDSTVTAYLYKRLGYKITLLHFKYGQQAEKVEELCIKRLAKDLKAELIIIDAIPIFKNFQSVLLSKRKKFEQIKDAESTMSYVPNRNSIFASIAGGLAEAKNIKTVSAGMQQMDSQYPDNSIDYVKSVDQLYKYSLNWDSNIKFRAPLMHMIKHEIVKLGLYLDVPFKDVCACYYPKIIKGKVYHCGTCGCCQYRIYSFKMLKCKDSAKYLVDIKNRYHDKKFKAENLIQLGKRFS